MDYLNQLGSLALGSRMKRLSERLNQEVSTIYNQQNVSFEPRWFPVFHFLGTHGETSIMDIAKAINVTHPAVNQAASEMLDADLIVQETDVEDKRRRLLSLSKRGKKLYAQLEPTWRAIRLSVAEAMEESRQDLLIAMDTFERALDKMHLQERFNLNEQILKTARVQISDFTAADRDSFRSLNEAWLRKYFSVEQGDLDILLAPEKIVEDGGMVFFARLGDKVVGTCALVKMDKRIFEIVKMGVDDHYQGMGIGRALLEACIKRARKLGATSVTLETSTKLTQAVKLYKKAGFKPLPPDDAHPSKFSRVDLAMRLDLTSTQTKTKDN